MKTIIYVGERFHRESSGIMSSLYGEDGTRYDWGLIQRNVSMGGEDVLIRPATHAELAKYQRILEANYLDRNKVTHGI